MSTFKALVRREIRVALSPKCQPLWFRVLKWLALLAFTARYHAAPWFWPDVSYTLGNLAAAIVLSVIGGFLIGLLSLIHISEPRDS